MENIQITKDEYDNLLKIKSKYCQIIDTKKNYFQAFTKNKIKHCLVCNKDVKAGSWSNHKVSNSHQANIIRLQV